LVGLSGGRAKITNLQSEPGDDLPSDFIKRAIELADADAVRVTLFQHTQDAMVAALPVAAKMSADDRAVLFEKAVAWLTRNASPEPMAEPSEADLRRLMDMAAGGTMGDLEFAARRDLPGFKAHPYAAEWDDEAPELPTGFKVAIIGSGFAGIGMAVQLDLLDIPYFVLERQSEAGGVWCTNRYPDVRVDTSSITYEFGFEKTHRWSEYFGRGDEVRDYLNDVSRRRGIWDRTLFNHDLIGATFDTARDCWMLDVKTPEGSRRFEANVIVSASGLFSTPRYPSFEGQDSFVGQIVHTARWTPDIELAGKRIAMVGNGSTGVQALGAIAGEAAQVHVFQRTPQWIMPRDKYGMHLEPEITWLLENFPGYANWWHFVATAQLFETHDLMLSDPEWQRQGGQVNVQNDAARVSLTQYIKAQTADRPDLTQELTPDYAPYARRPVVDNGWYRALMSDHVELVTDAIVRLHPKGIETVDGKIREVDTIVLATGFEVAEYLWPTHYIGSLGTDLHESWNAADGARAYIGMMIPDFPNLFTLYGPNSQPVSGGPAQPVWFAIWSAYVAKVLMQMLRENKSRVEVKRDAFDRYNRDLDAESQKLVMMTAAGGVDRNYYVSNKHDRLQVNAPWYSPEYHRLCSIVAWDDLSLSGHLVAEGKRPPDGQAQGIRRC
jgi:4-hydroxyacetophenone monooxygenase